MQLQDFSTLEEAQAHPVTTYKKSITAGQASQFFGTTGMLKALQDNTSNTTLVQLTPEMPQTTVGELCQTVLNSAATTGFAADPSTQDGALNRAGSSILVDQGIFSLPLETAFWKIAELKNYPYANTTAYQFAEAKGGIPRSALTTTANGDYVVMEISQTCESHSPKIKTASGVEVAKFFNVSLAGKYVQQIPNAYRGQALFVDNVFNAVV